MKPLLEIAIEKIPDSFDPDEILPARAGHLVNLERRGFIAGAQWRINSVWHSGNEVPKKHKDLLIELKNIEFHICQFRDGDSFLGYYDDREFIAFEIISWAYIEDLLPADSE